MTKKHRDVLAKLDPVAVARYQITEKDIRTIEQYLKIIQADLYGALEAVLKETAEVFKVIWRR